MAHQQLPIKTLASRHPHAMNFYRPKERGTFARACFYSAYRCSRIALQAGILETADSSSGFFGEAFQALKSRGVVQEAPNAEV